MTGLLKRIAQSPVLGALALIVVIVAVYLRARGHTAPDAASASNALWVFRDFRDSIYFPAVAFFDGVNPYDPQAYRAAYPVNAFPLYSPLSFILYAPFAGLPYETARWVYFGATIALYGVLAAALLRFSGHRLKLSYLLWLWALIVASRPGHQNLLNGQSTAQVVLGILLALQYAQTRPALATLGIALASLKPTFGVPLVVLLLCQGHIRTVLAGGAAVAVATAAILLALVVQQGGIQPVLDAFMSNLGSHGQHPNTNLVTSYSRIDLAMFLARWFDWIPGTGLELLIGAGLLLVVGTALRLRNYSVTEHGMACWSSVVIAFAIPLCIYHQSYDSLTLIIAAAALAFSPLANFGRGMPLASVICLVCALIPLGNYLVTDGILKSLDLAPGLWRYATVLNSSAIVTGLMAAILAMRGSPRPTGQVGASP